MISDQEDRRHFARAVKPIRVNLFYHPDPWTTAPAPQAYEFECYIYQNQRKNYELDGALCQRRCPLERGESSKDGIQHALQTALEAVLDGRLNKFHRSIIGWGDEE